LEENVSRFFRSRFFWQPFYLKLDFSEASDEPFLKKTVDHVVGRMGVK
jgi:hypothetical protein